MQLRASALPLLQAMLIGSTTVGAIVFLSTHRPHRARRVPFYSDASHNDPERTFLCLGENAALIFGTLAYVAEHAYLRALTNTRFDACRHAVALRVHAVTGLSALVMWLVTANTPTRRPFIRTHQMAASLLMTLLAIQMSAKCALSGVLHDALRKRSELGTMQRWWVRQHARVRKGVATALWLGVCGTLLSYGARVTLTYLYGGAAVVGWMKLRLITAMTMAVYGCTLSAVAMMLVSAVDLHGVRLHVRIQAEAS